MNPRRKFRPIASASHWGDGDREIPIVRIYGGVGKRGVAVAYDEIDTLVNQLRRLQREHDDAQSIVQSLVIDDR